MSSKKCHPVDEFVGQQLRNRRAELKVSQEQLANSVSLTFQQIQKYEKGLNRISCSKLYDFAQFLGTDIGYFFKGLDRIYRREPFYSYIANDDVGIAADSAANSYVAAPDGYVDGSTHSIVEEDVKTIVSAFAGIKKADLRKKVLSLLAALEQNVNP